MDQLAEKYPKLEMIASLKFPIVMLAISMVVCIIYYLAKWTVDPY